ncbi:MAG: radical SAM protein [Acidimicrobiia bacterium]
MCGGPYANPYALAAFVEDARRRGAERLFCLGDLGGFGADVDALFPILTESGVECIAGNYDVAIGRGDPDCGCGYRDERDNRYAQIIYDHTRAHTSEQFAAWMRTLPLEHRELIDGVDVHLVHGSPLFQNDFFWESLSPEDKRERAAASGADVLLCTHTGLPWQEQVGATLVVNVGALGRPANDGTPDVHYAVVDLAAGAAEAELVVLAYDWEAQAASMRAAGLPEPFVETIISGWWTTCIEVLPPLERSRGRYQLYRSALPEGFLADEVSWGGAPAAPDDGLPVVALFGSALFPSRLWVYTNFHCNLACLYCSVASSPTARRRSLSLERVRQLVDEAVDEGFGEIYLTGGEPFLEPDIADMTLYSAGRLPTVLLTNAMLFRGRGLAQLERLADAPDLVVQTSIDAAEPAVHDALRGQGSWQRAMDGLATLRQLGMRVRVGCTDTGANGNDIEALRRLLADHGVVGDDLAVRPLVKRGVSIDGLEIYDATTVPELTVTADGVHWHPAGADVATSPDMHLGGPDVSLAEGRRRAVERFLSLRLQDGTLPRIYNCAV